MKSIISKHEKVQKAMFEKEPYSPLNPLVHNCSVGVKYHCISQMKFFLDEEVTELMEELGNGTREIHKPWKKECIALRSKEFISTDKIKEEAIDVLCFALNICLAAGLDENNIEEEYEKVFNKIMSRMTEVKVNET